MQNTQASTTMHTNASAADVKAPVPGMPMTYLDGSRDYHFEDDGESPMSVKTEAAV